VRVRQRPAIPDARELGILAALMVCGLNSKEMAITLPAAICSTSGSGIGPANPV
jgi:hypothetical protein